MNKTKITVDQLQGSGIDTESAKEAQSSKRIEIINSLKSDFEESADKDGHESGMNSNASYPIPIFVKNYRAWLEKIGKTYPEIDDCTLKNAGMTCENYNERAKGIWAEVMQWKHENLEWIGIFPTEIGDFTYDTKTQILTDNSFITIKEVPRNEVDRALEKILLMYNTYGMMNGDFDSLMAEENY